MKKINIAIDGYSSTGKSTIAKDLANALGYTYIDTGAMYRAVTLYLLREGLWQDGQEKGIVPDERLKDLDITFIQTKEGQHLILNGEDVEKEIREMRVSNNVSPVSALPEVRTYLLKLQKALARDKGVVMDGRDVGTTIIPDAELKIFTTSRPEVRAKRRHEELISKGQNVTIEEIVENLTKRDRIDSTREISPLRQAEDAILLDNSDLSMTEQNTLVLQWARDKMVD